MSLPSNYNLLKDFPNKNYIETGIWRGDSIQTAIDAGFQTIYGLESDPEMVHFCKNRFDLFRDNSPLRRIVTLYLGYSLQLLPTVLRDIDGPATIFLDAHYSLLEGEELGHNPFPLMDELKIIRTKSITNTHTIIIDDLLYLTHPDIYKDRGMEVVTRRRIVEYLKLINPNYDIRLIANPVVNNLLIATI